MYAELLQTEFRDGCEHLLALKPLSDEAQQAQTRLPSLRLVLLAVYVVWTRKIAAGDRAEALREAAEVLSTSAGDGDDALGRWAAGVAAVPGSSLCSAGALPDSKSLKGWLQALQKVKYPAYKFVSGAGFKPSCQAALLEALADHVGASTQVGNVTSRQAMLQVSIVVQSAVFPLLYASDVGLCTISWHGYHAHKRSASHSYCKCMHLATALTCL
jgi:hypothetical protein